MPNPRLRIDQLPMHRRASAHGAGEGVAYERREVDPDSEELARRTGSTRQAQYAQALGFTAEQPGAQVVIDKELDLSGNWSIGFSVDVGDILEVTSGYLGVDEWTLFYAGDTAKTNDSGSIRCWLARINASQYRIQLEAREDDGGSNGITTVNCDCPGDKKNILITKSGTTLTLNVNDASSNFIQDGDPITLSATQIELLGTHKITSRAGGKAPIIDNFQYWSSVVATNVAYEKRDGTSSAYAIKPADLGGNLITPSVGTEKAFLHPSPPEIDSSKLYYSGFGGALRIPFRSIFERYFQTQTEEVGSDTFTFRVKGQRRFRSGSCTLIDFGSDAPLGYLKLSASGVPNFKYGDVDVTSTVTIAEDADFEIFCGVNGTKVFIAVNGEAETGGNAKNIVDSPFLDLTRIPDLYIGNDEDPTQGKHFHGYLTAFQFYDYAAKAATGADTASPVIDLDFSGDYIRDKGPNRIAIEKLSHATTEGAVVYAPGPLTDQSYTAVQQEVVFGPVAVGYTGKYAAPISSDASSVRAGDKAFVHSGDYVHVLNSELLQVRPLGLPEPGSEVSCRATTNGALDGVYQYGYRYQSQDGTYGPMKRLKPLTAFGQAGVLVGSGDAAGVDDNRELGESYGQTNAYDNDDVARDNTEEYFYIADTADIIHEDISDSEDLSLEAHLAFPDFNDFHESVFDRGVTQDFSDDDCIGLESDTEISLNPNEDFTLQASFRLDNSNLTSDLSWSGSTKHGKHQGIFGIGERSRGAKTRAFMLYLDIDGNGGDGTGYSAGTIRMVAARPVGRKEYRYKYICFNSAANEGDDSSLWVQGKDYTVVAVREGSDLKIYVYRQDSDGTNGAWYDFTGGECVDFFGSFESPDNNYALNFFGVKTSHENIADLETEEWSNSTYGTVVYGTSVAYEERSTTVIYSLDRESYLYHARAWSRAWPSAAIKVTGRDRGVNSRFAAIDGNLTDRIKSDVGVFDQDPAENPRRVFDKAANVHWKLFKKAQDERHDTLNCDTTQVKGSPLEFNGVTITDSSVGAIDSTQFRIFASSVNNGSIIVTTNKASYIIANKPWDTTSAAITTIPLSDVGIDPRNFNWFTTSVNWKDSTNALQLIVNNLYVNGNRFFDAPLDNFGTDIMCNGDDVAGTGVTHSLKMYLGGFNYSASPTPDGEVRISEFRLWKTDRYDDVKTEKFDFLTGRVATDEISDMYAYAKFQPSDLVSSNDYALASGCLLDATDVRYIKSYAKLIDTRSGEGSGVTDPAPSIAIPDPPYPWITAVQLFRTEGYYVEDTESAQEVATALDLVKGQPAYFLARVPSGDSSFVDIAPDGTLGYEAPEGGEGFVPEKPNGVCIWQNQLAIFRGNNIYFSERGPFGWESFPIWASYSVPTSGSGSDIVGAVEIGSSLLVCGQSWATILSGAPSQPRPFDLGPGTGAQSARCLAVHGGVAYALGKGKLWRVGQDGSYDDQFSQPIHDLLPTQGRVAVVGALSSLLIIDEQSDQVLRFHFPTQSWAIEERDALGVGDQGTDYFVVHQGSGGYSKGSTVYGDDVAANTVATSTSATKASGTTLSNVTVNPNIVVGTRVLVVDTAGVEVTATASSYDAGTDILTVVGDLSSLSGTANACTIYYGVGPTGMMVDTGWFAAGSRNSDISLLTDVTSGSFDFAIAGTDTPGDRSSRSGLSYADLGSAYETTGTGGRGRYVRAVVRNRTAQAASLGHAELEVKVEQQ